MDEEIEMDCSSETMETEEGQKKCRDHAGPLPKVVYDLFLSCVRAKKLKQIQYPTGPDLKAIGFPKPKGGHSRRERFKQWSERMDTAYDPERNTEILIRKRTRKIIIPLEEFETVARMAHEKNDNGGRKHNNFTTTLKNIHEKYTMGGRGFGMGRGVIRYVIDTCQKCIMDFALIKSKDGNSTLTTPICNGLLAPESCSMVAQVPNTACIWFDKSVLVSTTEIYPKLLSLISEMRGELPGIAKGNREAKGRFLLKIYTTVEFIRSQKVNTKAAYQTTQPFSHQMHDDLTKLYSVYEQDKIEHQFLSDMDLLLDVYRTAGYSDYFLRSLQASISLACQNHPDTLKQEVSHTNGLMLDYRDGITYLPHDT